MCHLLASNKVKMQDFFKNLLLYPEARFRQTENIEMKTKEASSKIVNFMTPGAGVLVLGFGHTVEIEYSFSSSCRYWGMFWIRQIKYMEMMTKEGCIKIVNFS